MKGKQVDIEALAEGLFQLMINGKETNNLIEMIMNNVTSEERRELCLAVIKKSLDYLAYGVNLNNERPKNPSY